MGHGLLIKFFDRRPRLARSTVACWILVCFTIANALCWASPALAAPVELRAGDFSKDLASSIRYYEDAQKKLNVREAWALDRERDYRPVETNLVDFGFKRSRYWLVFTVHNATDKRANWKLALEFPFIEQMDVYLLKSPKQGNPSFPLALSTDETRPFHDRGYDYRYFVTDIPLEAGASAEILISYSSKQATQLPVSIASPDHFHSRIKNEDLQNWAPIAVLIGMTLISIVYLTALGFSMAVIYGLYVLLSALYLFHTDGYAFQYLWPDWPLWNSVAVAPIAMAMVACGSLFARSFVDAPVHHPILNRFLLGSVIGALILLVISPAFIEYGWFKSLTLLFVAASTISYLLTGILAVRRGQAGGGFFIAGASAVISSILFGIIGYFNPGEFNQDITGLYGRYALLFEGAAFSLAIFQHIQVMRGEHEDTMRREIEITREKLAISEELHVAQRNHEHAVAVAESRREQLAATAHDIKQPLVSLRMALMRMDTNDDKTADQILDSFDYLDQLVRTTLEQTDPRALAGAHPDTDNEGTPDAETAINPHDAVADRAGEGERFPVMVVLNNVFAMFKDEAREKGLALTLVPSSLSVKTHPVAMMRIVANLVSNAIKYTKEGRVLVGCRQKAEMLCIEIHDSGPGISDDDIDRLLKPYERGETPGGTGLGLAVVSDLAQQHGMTFDISSIPGRGTVSKLSVPLD